MSRGHLGLASYFVADQVPEPNGPPPTTPLDSVVPQRRLKELENALYVPLTAPVEEKVPVTVLVMFEFGNVVCALNVFPVI